MKDWEKEVASFRERNRIKRKWLLIAAIWLSIWVISDSAHAADTRLILNLLACESGLQSDAQGDDGVSRGIAQFRKETFYEFARKAIKQKK